MHILRPSVIAEGPGPLFLSNWGALAAFVILVALGIGGWRWLLNRNRDRIALEQERLQRSGRVSPERRR